MNSAKHRSILYAALALIAVVSLTYHLRELTLIADGLLHQGEHVRYPFVVSFPDQVTSIEPEAESGGVRKGDTILAISGHPYRGVAEPVAQFHRAHPGDRLNLQLRSSEGKLKSASIEMHSPNGHPIRQIVLLIVGVIVPAFCILLGLWVGVVRIRDPIAWIFVGMMISFGETAGSSTYAGLFGHDDLLQAILTGYEQFSANMWSLFMMLFGIYFPERLDVDRRWPWIKWLLIAPILARATQAGIVGGLAGRYVGAAISVERSMHAGSAFTWVHMAAISCFFAAIGLKTFRAASPDAARRVRLLYLGATISLTPVCILVLINLMRGSPIIGDSATDTFIVYVMLIGFPLTIAYVILIQRAMDVRVVIRQGLQYLLASKGLVVLQGVLTAAIIFVAVISGEHLNLPNRLSLVGAGIATIFVIQRFALKVNTWIDRRFFREAYDAEQLLSELAERVRTIVETGPLLETVANRISESLHIPRLAVLLNGGNGFSVAYALGYATAPNVVIPADSPNLEATAQRQLDAELVLPLSLKQKTLGFITLGPKRSEEPYSKADMRLLGSVVTQTGLALENSRLTADVAAEVAHRERLNREIEIAREVQERLFPQELPEIRGLDYAGSCRPAQGVGGDYYDFIALPDGKLGIAIGDVSGKGIPAALLMAGLRASLRGQTIQGSADLAGLMANVNKLVYESSSSNRYATFFYGEYAPTTRCLSYVNGGHNPPLVLRKPEEVIRLEASGPVVGLLPMLSYEQKAITLNPGDMFLAFTDGISEAMNAADEEWGEGRLIQAAWQLDGSSAAVCMNQLILSADQFAAGAKQHDDMTIIVARVL